MSATAPARDLGGRVVLVTGVGRGLGRALVRHLAGSGALVAGCARSRTDLDSLAAELAGGVTGGAGGAQAGDTAAVRTAEYAPDAPLLMSADVTEERSVRAWVDATIERWGRIDGLINNASVLGGRAPLRDVEPETWRGVIDVNLTGAFLVCRAVLPVMREGGGGSIVNVSSGVGDRPRGEWGAYAVSKWALEGFSWNLELEERDAGIRVNVVDPGAMRTDMRRAAYPSEDPSTLPDPIRIADLFVWLMHPDSTGTTGQRIIARDWRG